MFFLYGGETHRGAWLLPGTGVVGPGVQEGEVAHPFRRNAAFASVKTGGLGWSCAWFSPISPGFRGFLGLPLNAS